MEKTPMLGKIEGKRTRGWQRMKWLDSISDSVDMNLGQTPGESEEQGGQICCIQSHHFIADRWGNSGKSG